jgi:hypothetical protein
VTTAEPAAPGSAEPVVLVVLVVVVALGQSEAVEPAPSVSPGSHAVDASIAATAAVPTAQDFQLLGRADVSRLLQTALFMVFPRGRLCRP